MEETRVFSTRIVSIDYYMAPPIPDFDICYSSFQGGNVNEVPVIRIYGSTPAGQKTCLHIHRALPYLYVPCVDLSVQSHDGDCADETFPHVVSCALEKALKLSNAGAKQHVHGCSLVRARKFYGYHFEEDLFMKIYLYYPHDVTRAASLLLGGAVLNKSFQPYESHIPFLLQFLIDYNLSGMGHIHVSKMKFRPPIPDLFNLRKTVNHAETEWEIIKSPSLSTNIQAVSSGDACLHSPVWISSTVSADWLWQSFGDVDASDQFFHLVKRQSNSELEGDATVDEILNQQFRLYTPLSQTSTEVKMVQSLIPIWEEEYERTGMHSSAITPDSGKPPPEIVLKFLSCGLEFKNMPMGFSREAETSTLFEKHGQQVLSMQYSVGEGNLVEHRGIKTGISDWEHVKCSNGKNKVDFKSSQGSGEELHGPVPCEREDERSKVLSVDVDLPTNMEGTVTPKGGDKEAAELLRWFASSQAAEDLDSDDDLAHEIILSPLLPATNFGKVLEKAKEDYESESQQECQDILDSIDLSGFEELKERTLNYSNSFELDGSSDDQYRRPTRDSLEVKKTDSELDTDSKFASKQKRKRALWGSLPFSITPINFNMTSQCGTKADSCPGKAVDKRSDASLKNIATDFCDSKEAGLLIGCSVRDLMRKKRCRRLNSPECGIPPNEVAHISQQQLEFETAQDCRQDMCPTQSPILWPAFTDQQNEIVEQSPCLEDLALKDGHLHLRERSDVEAVVGGAVGSGKFSSSLKSYRGLAFPSHLENHKPMVSMPYVENYISNKSFDATKKEPAVFSVTACNSKPDTLVNIQALKYVEDRYDCKGDDEGNSFLDYAARRSSKSHVDKTPTYSSVLQVERFGSVQQGEDSMSDRSAIKAVATEAEPSEFVCMNLRKKPPKIEWADGLCTDASWSPTVSNILPCGSGDIVEGTSVEKNNIEKFLPSFMDQQNKEAQDKCLKRFDSNSQQAVIGVPTHYENDGTCLYLLAPKISPPSRDCVSRWLLLDDIGTSRGYSNSTRLEPSSVNAEVDEGCTLDTEMKQFCDDVKPNNQKEGDMVNLKKCSDFLQDISQISGPSGNSKATPVSQIGFRDPASVGGGQQLTLFSVEVQAECRGDLRPDPRFDAITVIAVAIQEDNECVPKIYVILCDNVESYRRKLEGIYGCNILLSSEEILLLEHFVKITRSFDPDILMGWDVQGGSLGFLAERAAHLGIGLLNNISRTPSEAKIPTEDLEICNKVMVSDLPPESLIPDSILSDALIEDEWGRTHASGIHVGGRVVLNVWRLMRGEIKLNIYTVEAVAEAVLRRKVPSINNRVLMGWYSSGPGQARHRCIEYIMERSKLNLEIINQLDLINRTSELARVFGIDFFSVLSRGSQYRVESMLLRLAHTQNYLAISPGKQQVASQPAMECLPLVMEPESGFYADPVVVLDFQSLYPSMIIAYNLCFCTCLGKLLPSRENTLGVSSYSPDADVLRNLEKQLLLTPNAVMYVPSKVRKGILPRLLEEILTTRIMVKQAMKKLAPSQRVLHRIFNARQLALKLIANVTYGYTAAGFSGRMPCAELADSIVQCGRRTLENAISFVNAHDKWKARVIYGDTDSMFVLLKGRTVEEAFHIGQDIASSISAMNPYPVTLKMEKVYSACVLLTKKRYVGYSYESANQKEPIFDAKGIETVRRDTCGAVAKTMEQSLRLLFEHHDLLEVKSYLQRQWTRILSGRVSLQDFVFAKEVRLGTYSARASSLLPPAASVAMKAMRADPRAEPRYAERIPYVVIHGSPGARLVDMVVDPLDLLANDSPYRLNDLYYINKQIIPALQRVFGLVGGDLSQWFLEMPRPVKESLSKRHFYVPNLQRTRIDYYYLSKHCILCGELVHASSHLCDKCSTKESVVAAALTTRTSKLEKGMQHLVAICRHCGGGDWLVESGVKCTSLACSVFFERRKVQKELQALSAVSTEAGFYPKCMVEWF